MIKDLLRDLLRFIVLVLIQVFILNNIQFSGLINPYFYIIFILLLPFETPKWWLLIQGFLLGISVDLFTHTLGMHTAACTAMAFARPTVLKLISPREGYENGTYPRVSFFGLFWFARYALVLTIIHHFVLFYTEMFRFSDFFITLSRAILSVIFTVIICIISQYFIFRK